MNEPSGAPSVDRVSRRTGRQSRVRSGGDQPVGQVLCAGHACYHGGVTGEGRGETRGTGLTTTRRANWRDLLGNRGYLALWAGQMAAQAGDPFRQMALQVFVYSLTGSGAALAALSVAMAVPTILLGPIAGVLVDRWDRRRIMLLAQALRAGLVAVLAVTPSIPAIYTISILTASIAVFYLPARNAILPMLVPQESLLTANSFSVTTSTILMMIAPALASLVIGACGIQVALGINALTFALAALAVFSIKLPAASPAHTDGVTGRASWLADLREGAEFVRRSPLVRGILVIFAIQTFGFAAVPVLQVIYVDRMLGLPPSALGYLMSAFAVGMLIGGAGVAALGRRLPPVRAIIVAAIGYGVFFTAMALTTWLPAVLAILAAMGACEAALVVTVPTLLQRIVPDHLRGRVFSVQNVILVAVMVLGMGLAGAAADVMPIRSVFLIGGAFTLAGGIVGPFVLREPKPEPETERG